MRQVTLIGLFEKAHQFFGKLNLDRIWIGWVCLDSIYLWHDELIVMITRLHCTVYYSRYLGLYILRVKCFKESG